MCPGGYPIAGRRTGSRLPARRLPGHVHRHPAHRVEKLIENIRNHVVDRRPSSAGSSTCCAELNRRHLAAPPGRRRARGADPVVRAGLPHADRRPPRRSTSASEPRVDPRAVRPRRAGRGSCLMARRLLERGVRFVQVWHGDGQPWDNHDDIETGHRSWPRECDQADRARCSTDLKAARHARRHAGHLGRRVRPHADGRAAEPGQPGK